MSSEQAQNVDNLEIPKVVQRETHGRVDINHLLNRVREEKKKEKKANIVLLGVIGSVFLTVVIILSF
tara:strand:+ start:92 stop:292 length:201 start_codon:yes stop_codon:yes gene_type:complete